MATKIRIKQTTFDEIIRENIVDLDMQPEEAINEAIQQLTSQGADLSYIVLRPQITVKDDSNGEVTVSHPLVDAIRCLQISSISADENVVLTELETIKEQCNLDMAHRFLASDHNVIPILLQFWRTTSSENRKCFEAILDTLSSAGNGHPDSFDADALELMCVTLSENIADETICTKVLKLMQIACKMHENNRQKLIELNVIPLVMKCLTDHSINSSVISKGCALLRSLVLDDDVRVEFGKAHDHAKIIVTDNSGIKILGRLMKENLNKIEIVSEILHTLCRLVVRNEYCQELVDIGVLQDMLELLPTNIENQGLVKIILHLMKALAGNDEVKALIMKSGGGSLVVGAMLRHPFSAPINEIACGTIAMLALRNPVHCSALVDAGVVGAVVKAMEFHKEHIKTQKQACLAIRNLVARTREYCTAFIDEGAEGLIRSAQMTYPELADEAKAALRDLGLQVELRELWTGQKNTINDCT